MGRQLFILVFLGLAGQAFSQDVPGQYVWPIAGYTNLSAGFCDFRTRHYHGGIDVSVNGQEGLPVRAADSGWVGRVSVGYWGYGKAVYIQLHDGRMAVYAHLSELSDKIQDYVEDEQYKSKRYQQNLFPEARRLAIARGEVIGKSGQTGAGPPHLHFEIRTKDNKPLNPLAYFQKPDGIRPSVYHITITPIQPFDLATPPSTVDGLLLPKTFQINQRTLAAIPRVTGKVGISILADDNIDAPRWTMSAYSHRLYVNDTFIGDVRYDSINYDHTRQIEIERVYDPDGGLSPRAVNLYRKEHNILWHYDGFSDDGILSESSGLRWGRNQVRIEVSDFAGNQTTVAFAIQLDSIPPRGMLSSEQETLTATPSWGGAVISLRTASSAPPDLTLDSAGTIKLLHWIRCQGGWQSWLPAGLGGSALWIKQGSKGARKSHALGWKSIRNEDGGLVGSPDGKANILFSPGDLYVSGFFRLAVADNDGQSAALTPLYRLTPRDIPFARDVRLSIDVPGTKSPVEKLAIYRRSGKSWTYEGRGLEEYRSSLHATIKSAGSFAILVDTKAPTISAVMPAKGARLRDPRPWIRFEVVDNLSGIGTDENLQLKIDGQWVPVEYDTDLRQAKARPRWELAPGEHSIEITARDNCGNESRFERVITILR